MKKTLIQGLIGIILFASLWAILSQFNWLPLIRIEAANQKTEEKLGKILWDVIKQSESINTKESVSITVDSLLTHICKKNNIERNKIKLHIINSEEVNAFALPDGHLVVYSNLIVEAENPEELCGILSHELAHIELNHVMKKLVTEIGLSTLISITTGGNGAEVTKETIKLLTSSAFDRKLEKEADLKAVDYLTNSNISCEPFANFLFRLSENENKTLSYLSWISTHPDSKTRAEYIIELNKNQKSISEAVIDSISWENLQKDLSP
jgi:predicted Zn-dependent protease